MFMASWINMSTPIVTTVPVKMSAPAADKSTVEFV